MPLLIEVCNKNLNLFFFNVGIKEKRQKMRLRKKAGRRIKYYKVCKLAVANNNNGVGMH